MVGNQIFQPDYTASQLSHLESTCMIEVGYPGSSGDRGGRAEAVSRLCLGCALAPCLNQDLQPSHSIGKSLNAQPKNFFAVSLSQGSFMSFAIKNLDLCEM